MVAMAENDTVPALDNILVEDAGWLYFCPWYDGGEDGGTAFLGKNYQDYDELAKMYKSEYCITLDELPKDLYSSKGSTVPAKTTETTTVTTVSSTTTSTTTSTTPSAPSVPGDILYGDANVNGKVDVSDAVLIMQSLANPSKYKLTEEGKANADCFNNGDGVTNMDALSIQRYMLKLTDKLPESSASQ